MAEETTGNGCTPSEVDRLSLADILQMYDEATQVPKETTILTPPQAEESPIPVVQEMKQEIVDLPEEKEEVIIEPVISPPEIKVYTGTTEPQKEPVLREEYKRNELIVNINELEDEKMTFDYTETTNDSYSVPSLIVTTPNGQYDLITTEGVNKLNQEIRDYLSELEHQFGRLQRSWSAKKQIKKTYTALEEAARHDASSDEIIKIGERVALLKETVRTETPTKEELSNLLMKLETTRSIFARYIDILWHS